MLTHVPHLFNKAAVKLYWRGREKASQLNFHALKLWTTPTIEGESIERTILFTEKGIA